MVAVMLTTAPHTRTKPATIALCGAAVSQPRRRCSTDAARYRRHCAAESRCQSMRSTPRREVRNQPYGDGGESVLRFKVSEHVNLYLGLYQYANAAAANHRGGSAVLSIQ